MLSRIFLTHRSFGETCSYVCQDLSRAQVLDTEGVRGHDHRLMAEDFVLQNGFMPEKESPVFHGMLSFPPGEDPGAERMVEIARRYLDEIEVKNTQFAIVLHTDKGHLHLHIIANKVDNDGVPTGKGLILERGVKAARKLTQEYGLRPENGKNLALTHLDALNEYDARRYRLYRLIRDALPHCVRMEDLEKRLLEEGVTTRYRTDGVSGERQGISFRIERNAFAGSKVDPAFSYGRLRQTLQQQEEQRVALRLREEEAARMHAREALQEEALRKRQEEALASRMREEGLRLPGEEPLQAEDGARLRQEPDETLRHRKEPDQEPDVPERRHRLRIH